MFQQGCMLRWTQAAVVRDSVVQVTAQLVARMVICTQRLAEGVNRTVTAANSPRTQY